MFVLVFLSTFGFLLFFIPTIIAFKRMTFNRLKVVLVNLSMFPLLLLPGSYAVIIPIILWIIAGVMSCSKLVEPPIVMLSKEEMEDRDQLFRKLTGENVSEIRKRDKLQNVVFNIKNLGVLPKKSKK